MVCVPHAVRYVPMLSEAVSSSYYFDGMGNLFIAYMSDLHTAGGAFGQDVLGRRFFQGVF